MSLPLKIAVIGCVIFSLLSLGSFAYKHVPPYSEGECFSPKANPLIIVKVDKNDIMSATSSVTVEVLGYTQQTRASFMEIREIETFKTECL